ncbi:hypothetical protein FISHEDRAFT_78019 [Fistulina hepatica ATCC 64428]|nr:hypothetical protein FISHEDRAFT_78019 [Fistulina hepatica ATCC 64428]
MPALSAAKLKDAIKAAEEEHGQAKCTKAAYNGYHHAGQEAAYNGCVCLFALLFSDVLMMFITDNCLTPNGKQLQHSTTESCQATFVKPWEGPYYYDNIVDKVTGCPAKSQAVKSVVKLIKDHDNSKGGWATRAHAEAMHLEDLETIMAWSLVQCPISMVNIFIIGKICFDHSQAKLVMEHTMMHAFLSTGMTLVETQSHLTF